MRRAPLAFAALLGLVGCGRTDVYQAVLRDPATTPGGGAKRAEIYFASQGPGRLFYEVALVQAVGTGTDANIQDVARALADRAGQLGCDAVVNVQIDQGYTVAHGYGVCVRWSGAAPAGTSAAPAPAAGQPRPPLLPKNDGDDDDRPL